METFDISYALIPTPSCCKVVNCQKQSGGFLAHPLYSRYVPLFPVVSLNSSFEVVIKSQVFCYGCF